MTGTALVALAWGLACICAGLAWLLGPWGLIGFGIALTLVVVAAALLVDVKEATNEAVARTAGAEGDHAL